VRWPLKNQILLPMVGLMLAALVGVTWFNAYLSVRRTRQRIDDELAQVVDTLTTSNFPLTDGVLRQMSGLSGAEFVLTDSDGDLVASSSEQDAFEDLPIGDRIDDDREIASTSTVESGDRRYFHKVVRIRKTNRPTTASTLHILYPEENYNQAFRDVVYPPMFVGGAAIVLVIVASLVIASRVTHPLGRLLRQVEGIATGNFQLVRIPERNDEIADLSCSVNRMAKMLATYESDVRRNEQLRTLGQLGGGIAHQIRNSVTGCRMAVDLHARQCSLDDESLDVANRQLELMEKYLQRFLSLGRSKEIPHRRFVLQPLIENVVSLVRPTARHLGVQLGWQPPDEQIEVCGDPDALEQLMVNLVLNAIEAASSMHDRAGAVSDTATSGNGAEMVHSTNGNMKSPTPQVTIGLERVAGEVHLTIEDNGRGPSVDVEEKLFDPFVTEKPDGTGLGLSVAREIARSHGGEIRWQRTEAMTVFWVELPAIAPSEAICHGDTYV